MNSASLRHAYDARDTVAQAIASLRARNSSLSTQEALALAKLVDSLDTAIERIRILRGKPLPGTARTKRPAAKDSRPPATRRAAKPISAKQESVSTKPDGAQVDDNDGAQVDHSTPSSTPVEPSPAAGSLLSDYPG